MCDRLSIVGLVLLLAACGGAGTAPAIVGSDGGGQDAGAHAPDGPPADLETEGRVGPDLPLADADGLDGGVPDLADVILLPDLADGNGWADLDADGEDQWEEPDQWSGETETIQPPPDEECLGPSPAWTRGIRGVGGTVTFTELQVVPPDGEAQWVELHNPFSIDMDLSDWELTGDISYRFPDGTFLGPGACLVVAATGDMPQSLGPWQGSLDLFDGKVSLVNNRGRLMDRVAWQDRYPWPLAAFGSGATLAKHRPGTSSEWGEHWRASAAVGGTPGSTNFPDPDAPPQWLTLVDGGAQWAYSQLGAPDAEWTLPGYDADDWDVGDAAFYAAGEPLVAQPAEAWFTADNFFALYTGPADGSSLTYVGRDSVATWTSPESFSFTAGPEDHLYAAVWEAPGADGGPQMVIGEVLVGAELVPTAMDTYEWILGPTDGTPGGSLADPPPAVETLTALIDDANQEQGWAAPAVAADKSSSPWGGQVGQSFDSATQYIWADTFSALSVTNSAQTYALFRTVEPLLAPPGQTALDGLSNVTRFRTEFELPAPPAQVTLWLDLTVAPGAVCRVNGTEVARVNLPDGPLDNDSLALGPLEVPAEVAAVQVPGELLVAGTNVVAVTVYQASTEEAALYFDGRVQAQVLPADPSAGPGLRFSEVAGGNGLFWLEMENVGGQTLVLDGYRVSLNGGLAVTLAGGLTLAPGAVLQATENDLGLSPEVGDVLFLHGPDGTSVVDAVRVAQTTRARLAGQPEWVFPDEPSPGVPNPPLDLPAVVINEIFYHAPSVTDDGDAQVSEPLEWVELYNAGDEALDLAGWGLVDGVAFSFPETAVLLPDQYLVVARDGAAFEAAYPGLEAAGEYAGKLSNDGERIALVDSCGRVVDEVHYLDGGYWPEWPDGGGASLELTDPRADNGLPGAWAASREGEEAAWHDFTIEGVVEKSAVGPDGQWHELVLGLVNEGVLLVDDVSLVEDPEGAALERLQNGDFESGEAAAWRLLGNHRHSEVVPDPDDPANPVLRLVATGTAGHMHNHAETTLADGASVANGETWRLSFRARFEAGSNLLSTRLYFNRLAQTTAVPRPGPGGTPGAPNSTAGNGGPAWAGLRHRPAVPGPMEPVAVTVRGADPDGLADVVLHYVVDGGDALDVPMTGQEDHYVAQLPGQPEGALVQFWVSGVDGLGLASTEPPGGAASRAMYRVVSPVQEPPPMNTLRLLLDPADEEWLHATPNLMSNDRVGATVIWNERQVFYDVGVRLKGSERGRPKVARLGYSVRFRPDAPLLGVYRTVMVDRSEGVGYGQREMLNNFMMARAGAVSAEYSDLVHLVAPRSEHTGAAELQLTRFEDAMLAAQFEDGDDGLLYEYEYIYYPTTTTDGNPESPKVPQPDSVMGTKLKDIGESKEDYRFIFLPKNNRSRDEFDDIMAFAAFFGAAGPDFSESAASVVDVDQWLRAFAFATLPGAIDHYGNGNGHNAVFYVRPGDQRVLYFPHDLDFFPGSPHNGVVANSDLAHLIASPQNARIYYGHLLDIINTAYNAQYMGHWCDQMGALLPGQNFAGHLDFISQRADWVMSGADNAILQAMPQLPFAITTNDGEPWTTEVSFVALEGEGWIDVRTIRLDDPDKPLAVTWTDASHWVVEALPLLCGENVLALTAFDFQGQGVGSDVLVVTRTGTNCP